MAVLWLALLPQRKEVLDLNPQAGGLDSRQIIHFPPTCPKDMRVRLTANFPLGIVNGCLPLCVISVTA